MVSVVGRLFTCCVHGAECRLGGMAESSRGAEQTARVVVGIERFVIE